MTWGSHCPQCGCENCEWVRGAICDGGVRALRAERDEADRLAGEAERRRKYDEDELIRLRWWSERVKEAIGLRFNDSLDDVIPEIERALSALKETSDE